MKRLDLGPLASSGAKVLIGHDKGIAARTALCVDDLDRSDELIDVIIPKEIMTLTPSFVQGLFTESVRSLGESKFYVKYRFVGPETLVNDIRAGVDRVMTDRKLGGF